MRNTWAAYLVDIDTGRIEWTLGGKHSSFKFGPGAAFQWQHDVALQPGSTVSLFDDHCCQLTGGGTYVPATGPSRGLVLKLDPAAHTATLAAQYTRRRQLRIAHYMGDTQPLPNGNVFVGWGSEPYFSEYSRSGRLLLEGEFPGPDLTYRATVEQWVGLPLSPPAGAARQADGKTTVYASWNGATQVVSWRVLAGPSASRLSVVASAAKSGFETAIPVPQSYASFKVQALDADGRVIGASRPFSRSESMMIRAGACAGGAGDVASACARAARPQRPARAPRSRALAACARAAAANPVAVSPQPGTPDASPSTQISFLGAAGHAACPACAWSARAAASTRASCAPTRPGRARASCRPIRSWRASG